MSKFPLLFEYEGANPAAALPVADGPIIFHPTAENQVCHLSISEAGSQMVGHHTSISTVGGTRTQLFFGQDIIVEGGGLILLDSENLLNNGIETIFVDGNADFCSIKLSKFDMPHTGGLDNNELPADNNHYSLSLRSLTDSNIRSFTIQPGAALESLHLTDVTDLNVNNVLGLAADAGSDSEHDGWDSEDYTDTDDEVGALGDSDFDVDA